MNLNRAQRRALEKAKRHKPNRSAAIYTGHFQLEFETFDTIERMFEKLRNGEIEYEGSKPVIMGLHGEYYELLPAFDGWVKYWRELTEQQGIAYDDGAMMRLRNSLEYGMPLTEKQVEDAYAVVKLQRQLYRAIPKSITTKVAHAVMRDIRLDDQIKEAMRGQV
jgi:hypothetical protein